MSILFDILNARREAVEGVSRYFNHYSGFWVELRKHLLKVDQELLYYPTQWKLLHATVVDAALCSDSCEHVLVTVEFVFQTGKSGTYTVNESWIYPLLYESSVGISHNQEANLMEWLKLQRPKMVRSYV